MWKSEDILLVIKKVLEIIKNKKEMTYGEYKVKVDNFIGNATQENIAYGIWQFILNVLDEALVIEHGSSVNHSWLTSKGEELLKALNMIDDLQEVFCV